jgi:serine/threonine protein kinase
LAHELGHGGMSSIWQAEDSAEGRRVAIKFQEGPRLDANHQRRFKREVRALSQVRSPHIVKVFASGVDDGLTYIVMELLSGETLRRRGETRGRLRIDEVVSVVREAALGLGVAHDAGIVHRDIKPSNLFLVTEGATEVLKIIDFGIAKGDGIEASVDTTASGLIGSPAYMSPEQARAESVDARSDLWSLGVVAFRLLCGQEPFAAGNVPATLQRICMGPVPRISEHASGLPPALDDFFNRAFAHERKHRHQTAAAFSTAFERACASRPEESEESPVSRTWPSTPRPGSGPRSEVRVKGQAFHSVLRAFGELHGDELKAAALAGMGGAGGEALREGSLLSANFYPVAWYRELFASAARQVPGLNTLARDVGFRSSQRDVAGIYKVLLRALSTEMLIKQSQRLLRVVYEGGGVDVLEVQRGLARVRYHDYFGFDRNIWQDAIGGAEAAVLATGAKQLGFAVQQGGRDGDPHMVVEITWQ